MKQLQKIQQDNSRNNGLPVRTKSEVNFLVLPYFSLDKNGEKDRRIEFRDTRQRGDETYEIVWTVIPHPDFGLPRDFERRLQRAIEHSLSSIPRPISNPVPLPSFRELARLMGLACSGQFVESVKNALTVMMMTGIMSHRSYYKKSKKAWMQEGFHLYDQIVLKGEKLSEDCLAEHNYVYFTSAYLDNLNCLYVRPLDFEYLKSLKPIASRLYEILGVKFYGHNDFIQYKYSTLCQIMPLQRQKSLSRARQQFDEGHEELKQTAFLGAYNWFSIQGVSDDWYIRYYPGMRFFNELETPAGSISGYSTGSLTGLCEEIPAVVGEIPPFRDEDYTFCQEVAAFEPDSLWSLFSKTVRQFQGFDLRPQDREWFRQRVQNDGGWHSLDLMEEIRNWSDWLETEHRKKNKGEKSKFPQSNFKGCFINWLKHSMKTAIRKKEHAAIPPQNGHSRYPVDFIYEF